MGERNNNNGKATEKKTHTHTGESQTNYWKPKDIWCNIIITILSCSKETEKNNK